MLQLQISNCNCPAYPNLSTRAQGREMWRLMPLPSVFLTAQTSSLTKKRNACEHEVRIHDQLTLGNTVRQHGTYASLLSLRTHEKVTHRNLAVEITFLSCLLSYGRNLPIPLSCRESWKLSLLNNTCYILPTTHNSTLFPKHTALSQPCQLAPAATTASTGEKCLGTKQSKGVRVMQRNG